MKRLLVTAGLVAIVGSLPAADRIAAQDPSPATTVSTTVLFPTPDGTNQFPSGRFLVNRGLGPVDIHAGALHLTPSRAGVWAGIAGVQVELLDGPIGAAPFVDVGYGRIVRKVETERLELTDGEIGRFEEVPGSGFGAGGGVRMEWRVRPFVSVSGTAGYWHFSGGSDLDPVSGPFFGAGLRVGVPGLGPDRRPPVLASGPIRIQVEEPAAWATDGTRGIRAVARNSIRVVGTARDPVGVAVREVRINGQVAALRPLDGSGSLARFVGFAPVTEETEDVVITAATMDGRQMSATYGVEPTIPRVSDQGAAAAARRTAEEVEGRRYAVVIGISDYVDPEIPDLDYADDDALAFHEFLRSERAGLGGIPEEDIALLINEEATYRNMRSALYTFLEKATEDDLVYIYIAAHGAPNPNRPDDLFILPYDAEAADIGGTGLPMEHVSQAIQKLYARHTVLLTDACHSGGIGMGSFATRAAPGDESLNAINRAFLQDLQATQSGLAILTASEARQLSREGEQWGGGHGVFTWFLLRGLEGEADADGDQIVRLGELLEYVRDSVRRETSNGQIPAFGSNAFDRFMPMSIVPDEKQ